MVNFNMESDRIDLKELSAFMGNPTFQPNSSLNPFEVLPALEEQSRLSNLDETQQETITPKYTVGDIFRLYWDDYRKENSPTNHQIKTVNDIMNCRSGYFGYNINMCDTCGHTQIYANSCRNRHCPSCQGNKRQIWVDERAAELLPVPYYHNVLTLPDIMFPMCLYNQKVIYDLILYCSAETIKQFGNDPKWLGAEVGIISILHTWGQMIPMHLHVHNVIPGGGYDESTASWIWPKNKDSEFLFPIHAMADVFRGKVVEGLKKAFNNDELSFPEHLQEMSTEQGFEDWINRLVSKRWIAYVKKPFGGPEQVINYIGKYTNKTAISNSRIISIEDGVIRFMYKSYKKKHEVDDPKELWEETQLPADEFIRRFLYHILPPQFHRIRHYGFLSNGQKEKRQEIWEYLVLEEEAGIPETAEPYEGMPCPKCEGILVPIVVIDENGRILRGSFEELKEQKQIFREAEMLESEDFEWNTS